MDELYELCSYKLRSITCKYKRYLYDTINWDCKLVIIKGTRKTGKSTLLLQYVKENYKFDNSALYINLSDFYFIGVDLEDVVSKFVSQGGKHLFIDDVHSYPNWAEVFDEVLTKYETLKITAAGSPVEEYNRNFTTVVANLYELSGLSLREFILFSTDTLLPVLSINDIVSSHATISSEITQIIDPAIYMQAYLKYGYYPFFMKNRIDYNNMLKDAVSLILNEDSGQIKKVESKTVPILKAIINYFSSHNPSDAINISEISEKTGCTRKSLLSYIDSIQSSGLLSIIKNKSTSSNMTKPERVFLGNPNLHSLFKLSPSENCFLEKTYLKNQIDVNNEIGVYKNSDFIINNKIKITVTDRFHNNNTLLPISNSYYAVAGLEIGFKNNIPLWMFGLTY